MELVGSLVGGGALWSLCETGAALLCLSDARRGRGRGLVLCVGRWMCFPPGAGFFCVRAEKAIVFGRVEGRRT